MWDNEDYKGKKRGAKKKFLEDTETVFFQCPKSKVQEIKLIIDHFLEQFRIRYGKED